MREGGQLLRGRRHKEACSRAAVHGGVAMRQRSLPVARPLASNLQALSSLSFGSLHLGGLFLLHLLFGEAR